MTLAILGENFVKFNEAAELQQKID